MKIGIDMGHTLVGVGTGATKYVSETDINREVGKRLIKKLKEKGHTVYNCTVDKSTNDLQDRVAKANAQALDLFVSIHLNAGVSNGNFAGGTETYSLSSTGNGAKYAEKVHKELVNLGFRNRGTKTSNFYVLRKTNASAILVELFFVDSQVDVDLYKKLGANEISNALFKGITGVDYFNTSTIEEQSSSASNVINNSIPNFEVGTSYVYKKYKNGSTKEIIYQTEECKEAIGYLSPYEECICIGVYKEKAILTYDTANGKKVGFAKWLGGIQ